MAIKARAVSDLSAQVRLWPIIAAMIGLLGLTLLGPAMTMLGGAETGSGNLVRQAGYALIFLVTLMAIRPIRHPERLAVVPWAFWVALAWCWLSLSWAIAPDIAIRRLVLTTIIIWSTFAIVKQLGVAQSLVFIRWALAITLLANFAAVVLDPQLGVHSAVGDDPGLAGDWRGVMAHKNVAGLVSALTIIFFLFDRRSVSVTASSVMIAGSAVFLWFSGSKTSLGLIVIVSSLGFVIPEYLIPRTSLFFRRKNAKIASLFIFIVLLFPLIHFGIQSDIFLNFLSDPSGLTGRAEIWNAMVRYYLASPIFNAGYGSFWNINTVSPILTFGSGWVQSISEGHNGYLDLLVTIGLPGLVVVLGATLVAPIIKVLSGPRLDKSAQMLIVSILFFCLAHNFTESSLFDRDSVGWVFMLLALAMLWRGEGKADPIGARAKIQGRDTAALMNREARERIAERNLDKFSRKSQIRRENRSKH